MDISSPKDDMVSNRKRLSRGEKLAAVARAQLLEDVKASAAAKRVPSLPRQDLPPAPSHGDTLQSFREYQGRIATKLAATAYVSATDKEVEHLSGTYVDIPLTYFVMYTYMLNKCCLDAM